MTRPNASRRATLIQSAAGFTLAALSLWVSNSWALASKLLDAVSAKGHCAS